MAAVLKVAGIAFTAVIASLVLRAYRPELSVQIAVASGLLLLILTLDEIKAILSFLDVLFERTGIEPAYVKVLLKVLGIAYIAQFAADLCRDAGESAVAGKVEFAGRVMILSLCVPVFGSVLSAVGDILSLHAAT